MMFVDASVIISILTDEDDGKIYADILETPRRKVTSVVATWEASAGLFRKARLSMLEVRMIVQEFVRLADIDVLVIDAEDEMLALDIFETNGRHSVAEKDRNRALNMADCFHYAVAKRLGMPILTKDAGFAATDLIVLGASSR